MQEVKRKITRPEHSFNPYNTPYYKSRLTHTVFNLQNTKDHYTITIYVHNCLGTYTLYKPQLFKLPVQHT